MWVGADQHQQQNNYENRIHEYTPLHGNNRPRCRGDWLNCQTAVRIKRYMAESRLRRTS